MGVIRVLIRTIVNDGQRHFEKSLLGLTDTHRLNTKINRSSDLVVMA